MSEVAKATGMPILLVGHVTKEGAIAGPRTLEHMVDVVLYLEGERLGEHRMLRGIKNRFGATAKSGYHHGERRDARSRRPSRGMLDAASLGASGSVLTITCDGLRPMAVEVQALAVGSPFELPRRTASGYELNRLHLMLAVLAKRAGISVSKLDVFVNVAAAYASRIPDRPRDGARDRRHGQQPGGVAPLRRHRRGRPGRRGAQSVPDRGAPRRGGGRRHGGRDLPRAIAAQFPTAFAVIESAT